MRLTRRLFFVLLGLTGLIAIGAYAWQFDGLAGPNGIAPIDDGMQGLRNAKQLGFFDVPTLLWLSSSPGFVKFLLAVGCASSLALIFGLAPRIASLTLWSSWMSIVQIGHPFLAFQWDILLSEAAFCSIFYAPPGLRPFARDLEPEPHAAWRFVMAVLAAKVTLESGLVKVFGGDPSWRDLTALTYHWWSQPLPTWTSVAIARLPLTVQQGLCAIMFVLELLFPLLVFGPRRVRLIGAVGLIALQAGLMAAGNYSFYNLLTLVLCVPMLDDALLRRFFPGVPVRGEGRRLRGAWRWGPAILYLVLSVGSFVRASWVDFLWRFDTINAYGAFARMTKQREEIIIEGSDDGVTWTAYEFPWKPGRLDRRPGFIAPWQPRLDWQMWFASLGDCGSNTWVLSLQQRLLEGRPEVLALFETVPPKPPRFMRTRMFEYRFAPPDSPDWWVRTETQAFCPTVMLGTDGRLTRAVF
jgi:hypothetical protein